MDHCRVENCGSWRANLPTFENRAGNLSAITSIFPTYSPSLNLEDSSRLRQLFRTYPNSILVSLVWLVLLAKLPHRKFSSALQLENVRPFCCNSVLPILAVKNHPHPEETRDTPRKSSRLSALHEPHQATSSTSPKAAKNSCSSSLP